MVREKGRLDKDYMQQKKCHLSDKGYLFRMVEGKRIYLHRFIVECYLGRKLKDNEIVHHIDGNILNNDIENLEVITQSIHFSKHLIGNKYYKLRKHNRNKYTKGGEKNSELV